MEDNAHTLTDDNFSFREINNYMYIIFIVLIMFLMNMTTEHIALMKTLL